MAVDTVPSSKAALKDPTNPNSVQNIHRLICPGQDHYADGKGWGMSDDVPRADAAGIEAEQKEALRLPWMLDSSRPDLDFAVTA